MSKLQRGRRWMLVSGAMVAASALGAAVLAATPRAETPPPGLPSTTPEATATPTAASLPAEPTPWPAPPPPGHGSVPPAGDAPFGRVAAEPARVRTGDGDCLNVRYLPGTTGQPRVAGCAAEGTLLWLTGDPVEADGETWRYALGMGWVAARYTEPDPGAVRGFGPFREALVLAVAETWPWTQAGRVTGNGPTWRGAWLPFNAAWGVARPGPLSPSGRYLAFSAWEGEGAGDTVLVGLEHGTEHTLKGAAAVRWGPGDRLLLRLHGACDGCAAGLAWTEPPFETVVPISGPVGWNAAWMPAGDALVTVEAGRGLVVVSLDGSERVIPLALNESESIDQLVVSPSGRAVLAVPWAGDVRVIDLETGEERRIARPIDVLRGGCGGTPGLTAAWVDEDTIAWHESMAPGNGNGIVVFDLATGARRILPFISVVELRSVGDGLLAFSVSDAGGAEKGTGIAPYSSWLLDAATGEAWPAVEGIFAVWR